MASSFNNGGAIRWATCVVCMPLLLSSGCKPSEPMAPSVPQAAAEIACREIAVPAMPSGPAAAAARSEQLRGVLLESGVDPACLGAQLFRGSDSAAEQAVIIGLMQSDPQPAIRARAAATLGGVKGDPRPAFKALYEARASEKEHQVAAAQLAGIADLLASRAALQWDDGPTLAGLIGLLRAEPAAPPAPDQLAAARSVMVQRGRVAVVLGDILDQAVVANKAHRADAAVVAEGTTATTGDAAGTAATWDAYEALLTGLLENATHAGIDDADWRAPVLSKLADVLQNGRLNPRPRPELADTLVRAIAYPAGQVRVAALQAMGALVEASAQARAVNPASAPMVEPSTVAGMHAAIVKGVADPSPQVRAAAASALGEFAQHAGSNADALKPLLKDIDTQVRASAEEAIARRPAAEPAPAAPAALVPPVAARKTLP